MVRSVLGGLLRLSAAVVVAVVALLSVGVTPAWAHATVVSSSPLDGSNLASSPSQVSITFDESVGLNPGYLRVINGNGRRVDTGSAFHPGGRGAVVAVALPPNLPKSAYLASYRVVSADSHPVSGVVRFSVGGASLAGLAGAGGQSTDRGVSVLLDVARAVSFLGLAAAGGWWLLLWLAGRSATGGEWPVAARRLVAGGLGAALVGVLAELFGQGPYAAGDSLAGLRRADLLADTLASSFGRWHLAQLVLLAILFVVVVSRGYEDASRHPRAAWAAGGILWLAVLVCVAATGHAAVRTPVWLGELSTTVHLGAMTIWIGGLGVLAVSVLVAREQRSAAAVALPVFSRVALVCVATLAVTGTYQAWREVGRWAAFVDTEYGELVLAKIGLFAALIGLGALARQILRADDGQADPDNLTRLRRGVLTEIVLAAGVLVVSAVLVAQPPGRTAGAQTVRTPVSATVALSADRQLTVEVSPSGHGPVTLTLTVGPGDPVQQMTVTASLPSESIGPIPVPVNALDDLAYQSDPVDLPVAGIWQFNVAVKTSEFDVVTATVPLTLK